VAWTKLGRVYVAPGAQDWAQTHAYLPTALALPDDRIRVFVAFLDEQRVGRIGFVDVDSRDPTRVIEVAGTPALDIGAAGEFDDHGVSPLSVFRRGAEVWLYYAGWQLGTRIPYFLFTGLAVSRDEGRTFTRHARVPVFPRTDAEPTLRSGTFVMPDEGRFRAWYASGEGWIESGGKQMPTYELRYAESEDGLAWPARGEPCLVPRAPDEFGFGRPFLREEDGLLRMWYSIRSLSMGYRLGYAESRDGRNWTRLDDEVGIDVSESGWDSEMIHCAWVQQTEHGEYLFYNGNGYGETGFGVAVRSSS
jgi:hypothetical protein